MGAFGGVVRGLELVSNGPTGRPSVRVWADALLRVFRPPFIIIIIITSLPPPFATSPARRPATTRKDKDVAWGGGVIELAKCFVKE